jgi:hypothetical protein
MRLRATSRAGEQLIGRHLGDGVKGVQVGCETAHHSESLRPPPRRGVFWLNSPGHSGVDGDRRGAHGFQVGDEVGQLSAVGGQFEAEGSAHGQVVRDGPGRRVHAARPGHR